MLLGILGGMGPMATVDFMRKIVENTPASCDQDHLEVVACSAAKTPDRSAFIMGGGSDPFPAMRNTLRRLEGAGATIVAIPCNTAHHWHAALQRQSGSRILHIVDAVAGVLARRDVHGGWIGVLATDGTVKGGIYQDGLSKLGYECVMPGAPGQAEVMHAIRLVKGGELDEASAVLLREADALRDAGCRQVVMACTEIPIALGHMSGVPPWMLDATEALARACVEACSISAASRPAAPRSPSYQ